MTENVTLDDFVNWIEYNLSEVREETQKEILNIKSEASRRDMLRSSGAAQQIIEYGRRRMKEAGERAVGAFHHMESAGALSRDDLHSALSQCLRDFSTGMEAIIRQAAKGLASAVGGLEAYEPSIARIAEEAEVAIRHARTGLMKAPAPPAPSTVANKIDIGKMIGGAIQQGTVGSTQNTTIAADNESAKLAIARLEEALQAEAPNAAFLASMRADIDTIKAQLTKPEPSPSILRESWDSLRRMGEMAAASQVPTAVAYLGRTLGFA